MPSVERGSCLGGLELAMPRGAALTTHIARCIKLLDKVLHSFS